MKKRNILFIVVLSVTLLTTLIMPLLARQEPLPENIVLNKCKGDVEYYGEITGYLFYFQACDDKYIRNNYNVTLKSKALDTPREYFVRDYDNYLGDFTFDNLPSGTYKLSVELDGFKTAKRKIKLEENQRIITNIELDQKKESQGCTNDYYGYVYVGIFKIDEERCKREYKDKATVRLKSKEGSVDEEAYIEFAGSSSDGSSAQFMGLPEGDYQITVRKKKYKKIKYKFHLENGQYVYTYFELIKK